MWNLTCGMNIVRSSPCRCTCPSPAVHSPDIALTAPATDKGGRVGQEHRYQADIEAISTTDTHHDRIEQAALYSAMAERNVLLPISTHGKKRHSTKTARVRTHSFGTPMLHNQSCTLVARYTKITFLSLSPQQRRFAAAGGTKNEHRLALRHLKG